MGHELTNIMINCIECGNTISLDPITYKDYCGDIKCNSCKKILHIEIEEEQLTKTPKINIDIIKIPNLPKRIEKDLNEAQICFNNKAYKSCVVMCRRTLEQVCQDKEAEGNTLFEMINSLFDKGIISKDIEQIFTKIRIFGNYGAHIDNDLLGGLKMSDAKRILDITIHTSKHIYDVPDILNQLRNRRR